MLRGKVSLLVRTMLPVHGSGLRVCGVKRFLSTSQAHVGTPQIQSIPGRVLIRPDDYDNEGAVVTYLPSFIPRKEEADALFLYLRDEVNWRREIDLFGPQDRLSAYFGDEGCVFSYVGLRLVPRPWPRMLHRVRQALEKYLLVYPDFQGISCSACLVNNYPQGEGHIVWHRDETRAHGPRPLIISLSLCPDGERTFELKRRDPRSNKFAATINSCADPADPVFSLSLAHGSALIMAGTTQEHWLHRLPPGGVNDPHRISITFRSIVAGFEDALSQTVAADDCTK